MIDYMLNCKIGSSPSSWVHIDKHKGSHRKTNSYPTVDL